MYMSVEAIGYLQVLSSMFFETRFFSPGLQLTKKARYSSRPSVYPSPLHSEDRSAAPCLAFKKNSGLRA